MAILKIMKRLLTSCFGLGRLPVCPGTWGSLPPAVVFALLSWFAAPPGLIAFVMAAFVLAGSIVCIRFSPSVINVTGKTDPSEIVADEFAGQSVAYLAVLFFTAEAFAAVQIVVITLLGFLLFRLFDILKPWPIRRLEKFPKGWGILADDLLAGVYAGLALFIFQRFWAIYYIILD